MVEQQGEHVSEYFNDWEKKPVNQAFVRLLDCSHCYTADFHVDTT